MKICIFQQSNGGLKMKVKLKVNKYDLIRYGVYCGFAAFSISIFYNVFVMHIIGLDFVIFPLYALFVVFVIAPWIKEKEME